MIYFTSDGLISCLPVYNYINIFFVAGLEKSTRPLVFTSDSGCRAGETLDDFQCKLTLFPYMPIIFVMQGKCLF